MQRYKLIEVKQYFNFHFLILETDNFTKEYFIPNVQQFQIKLFQQFKYKFFSSQLRSLVGPDNGDFKYTCIFTRYLLGLCLIMPEIMQRGRCYLNHISNSDPVHSPLIVRLDLF